MLFSSVQPFTNVMYSYSRQNGFYESNHFCHLVHLPSAEGFTQFQYSTFVVLCRHRIRIQKCHNFRILLVKTKGASIVLTTKENYLKMVFLRLSYYDNDDNVFFFGAISFVTMFAPVLNNLNIKLGASSFVIMLAPF